VLQEEVLKADVAGVDRKAALAKVRVAVVAIMNLDIRSEKERRLDKVACAKEVVKKKSWRFLRMKCEKWVREGEIAPVL